VWVCCSRWILLQNKFRVPNVLRCVAVCCSVAACVAVDQSCWSMQWCITCVAVCCTVLQCVAVWGCVLQRKTLLLDSFVYHTCCSIFAVYCSVWQRTAVCCSLLQRIAASCSMLQYVAVCCSVLQRMALAAQFIVLSIHLFISVYPAIYFCVSSCLCLCIDVQGWVGLEKLVVYGMTHSDVGYDPVYQCDMTCSDVWHDSFQKCEKVWHNAFRCVRRFRSSVWLDLFRCVTWRCSYMRHMYEFLRLMHQCDTIPVISVTCLLHRHNSLRFVTRLRSSVWHDFFTSDVWHDSVYRCDMTGTSVWQGSVHQCDMAYNKTSFISVTWRSSVWHNHISHVTLISVT